MGGYAAPLGCGEAKMHENTKVFFIPLSGMKSFEAAAAHSGAERFQNLQTCLRL